MREATYDQKTLVINILTEAFEDNKSIKYTVGTRSGQERRINFLMDYCFEICWKYGKVYLSPDNRGCALVLYPDQKKTTYWSIKKDLQLLFNAIRLLNIPRILEREKMIKRYQFKGYGYYLWFIGVKKSHQGKGIGSDLMNAIIAEAELLDRIIYLETSTLKNIVWYQSFGLKIYHEIHLGYKLYFLSK